jgi:hypothetical protein
MPARLQLGSVVSSPIIFGNQTISEHPRLTALRPYLATGLPLSSQSITKLKELREEASCFENPNRPRHLNRCTILVSTSFKMNKPVDTGCWVFLDLMRGLLGATLAAIPIDPAVCRVGAEDKAHLRTWERLGSEPGLKQGEGPLLS